MLKNLFLKSDIDNGILEVSFYCPEDFSSCEINIFDNQLLKTSVSVKLRPDAENFLKIEMGTFILWEIDNPYLYRFEMTLHGAKQQKKMIDHRFGMRKVETRGKWVYVNNSRFYVKGYIRGREAHDHQNLSGLSKKEYYAKNIKAAKEFGFNLIRFHSRVPEIECLEMADELGMFVHVELRKYYGKYQKERSMMNDEGELIDRDQWINAVLYLRNHPCVMAYCLGNEIRHPGTNPFISEIASLTKKLDPSKLFIDTCAHGEFDRDYVDFDVQHMSYFYPFGTNYDMFDHAYNWNIYGSCKGHDLVKEGKGFKITRNLKADRPILGHEICHYAAMRDIDRLEEKFQNICPDKKPWWLEELKKLRKSKDLEKDWDKILKASTIFQKLSWKLGIEAVRRSPLLSGFHFLQLSDTDKYENCNGILDCFDDVKDISSQAFTKFNADTVILADLPKRTFFEGDEVEIPVFLSNFDKKVKGSGVVAFRLIDKENCETLIESEMKDIELWDGLEEICTIKLQMPRESRAKEFELIIELSCNESKVDNSWQLWLYPNRPANVKPQEVNIKLDNLNLFMRYPQLENRVEADLMVTNRFDDELFNHLKNGKKAMVLYRVPETRARINPSVPKEKYYLPATWDRFKGVIWDRGTNCGGFIRENDALNMFPNNGFIELQFHDIIDDCDKINLDDFPVKIDPIIQGVDKASRDRFDVFTYKLSELQPDFVMRKFGYLFEIKVGQGELLICGFNLTGIHNDTPASCAMFESLFSYINSDCFRPQTRIDLETFKSYLLEKSDQPRLKERKMTQFWQMNSMPLESDLYWETSEKWIETDHFKEVFMPEFGKHVFSKIEKD